MLLCFNGYTHSVDLACRLGYRVCKNDLVDLKPLWSKKKKKKKKKKKGEEVYRFVSNFVNRFVFLPFFFSKKKIKQTGCIIMYLHSASRLADKFTLDVCISKCVCMRTRARVCVCVRVVHACACTHSCVWPLWMYVCACVRVSAHMRHGCEHPGMYKFMPVSVFYTYSWH